MKMTGSERFPPTDLIVNSVYVIISIEVEIRPLTFLNNISRILSSTQSTKVVI